MSGAECNFNEKDPPRFNKPTRGAARHSSVAYTNGEKNGCHQGLIANTTVPTRSWSIFLAQPSDMRKPTMGRFLNI